MVGKNVTNLPKGKSWLSAFEDIKDTEEMDNLPTVIRDLLVNAGLDSFDEIKNAVATNKLVKNYRPRGYPAFRIDGYGPGMHMLILHWIKKVNKRRIREDVEAARAVAGRETRKVSEAEIEGKVVQWARDNGFVIAKMSVAGQRSWPDRLFIAQGGRHSYIEFKAPGKKPTPQQTRHMEKLEKQGCTVTWSDNVSAAIEWLQSQSGVGRG